MDIVISRKSWLSLLEYNLFVLASNLLSHPFYYRFYLKTFYFRMHLSAIFYILLKLIKWRSAEP